MMNGSPRIIRVFAFAGVLSAFALSVRADWIDYRQSVLDINFDGDTLGAEPLQTYPYGAPPVPFPATSLYAVGNDLTGVGPSDYNFANSNGIVHIIGNAAGLQNALIRSNNVDTINANWADTQYIPSRAERGDIGFDFAILQAPTVPNQQTGPNTPNGTDFRVTGYLDSGNSAFRFVTTHTSPTGGDIQFRLTGGSLTDLFTIGTYTNGVATHVGIILDYVHGTVNVDLNGNIVLSTFPFSDLQSSTNDQLTEIFFTQNGVGGQLLVTALDNITYDVVPEPTGCVLGWLGITGLVLFVRRTRS